MCGSQTVDAHAQYCSSCDSALIQKCSWRGLWMVGQSMAWSANYWRPLAAVLDLAWGTFDHPQTPTLLSHSAFRLPVQHGGNSTNLDSLPSQVHFEEPQCVSEINLIGCPFPQSLFPTRTLCMTHHHHNNSAAYQSCLFHIMLEEDIQSVRSLVHLLFWWLISG